MNGVEVADSPFPVFASIHPNQLGKPVRVITELQNPAGVACNSEEKIVVSELTRDVVLMDRKGNKLSSIKKSDHNLQCPRGVAVDEDDNIYITYDSANTILKVDKEMKKIAEQKGKSTRYFVAVVGAETMVRKHSPPTLRENTRKKHSPRPWRKHSPRP